MAAYFPVNDTRLFSGAGTTPLPGTSPPAGEREAGELVAKARVTAWADSNRNQKLATNPACDSAQLLHWLDARRRSTLAVFRSIGY